LDGVEVKGRRGLNTEATERKSGRKKLTEAFEVEGRTVKGAWALRKKS
jgi:hypothetical protein